MLLSAPECSGVSLSAAERRLKILVVLDNAASTDVVATLSSCGLNLLVTTRRSQIAPDRGQLVPDRSQIAPGGRGALIIEVGPVDDATARQILERGASISGKEAKLPVEASTILEACAGLPLALALAAALCRGGDEGAWVTLAAEWADTRRKLDEILPDEASTQFTQV